jgi:hypothetical protein
MPGPIVMHRKSSEGGYLLRFKKDRKVYTAPLAVMTMATGHHKEFVYLRTMNNRPFLLRYSITFFFSIQDQHLIDIVCQNNNRAASLLSMAEMNRQ